VAKVVDDLAKLVGRRPAESATLGAGAIGLLLVAVLGLPDTNVTWGLVAILALLPSLVTAFVARKDHDPEARLRVSHSGFEEDAEYVAERAIRKVLLGDVTWERDLAALQLILNEHPAHSSPKPKAGEQEDGQ
jgi:hypothetical protein